MIQSSFRPTFLLRRILQASGQPRTEPSTIAPEADQFAMGVPGVVENLWNALEPLILILTLAGYDCPEVIVASPSWGDPEHERAGYIKVFPHSPVVAYDAGDWRARTGASVGSDAWTVYLIRVTARRTLGAPSLYPPISLTGIPGYKPRADADDRFRNPADGWITMAGVKPLESSVDTVATRVGEPLRLRIARALADAWTQVASNRPIGLLRSFNPEFWETANDRELPVRRFARLAGELWTFLESGSQLRTFLQAPPADPAASLEGLMSSASASTSRFKALRELMARLEMFHPRHTRLETAMADWRRQHWAFTLFELHEFGVLRVLPFPLSYEARIPSVDLTGWYESESNPFDPAASSKPVIATMHLNQAGDVIEGWWYTAQLERWDIGAQWPANSPRALSLSALLMRSNGDRQATLGDIPSADGSAEDVDFAINVTFAEEFNGYKSYRMIRRHRLSQVSPGIRLAALPADSPAMSEGFLPSAHYLSEIGMGRALDVLIDGVLDVSTRSSVTWAQGMRAVERTLRATLADNNILTYTDLRIPWSLILDRFRVEARLALSATPVPSAGNLDAWSQLQVILNVLDVSDIATATLLRGLLDIGPALHEYDLQFAGLGAVGEVDAELGASGGAMLILARIHHETQSCGGNPVGWPSWYWGTIVEGGGSIGFEKGVAVNFIKLVDPDSIQATSEWFPDDFATRGLSIPPRCAFATLGWGAEIQGRWKVGGGAGWDVKEGVVFISRTAKGIAAGWNDGWYAFAGWGFGGGLGATAGFSIGVLYGRVTSAGRPGPQDPPAPVPPISVFVDGTQELSFASNSATLNAWGRARLAKHVARYRALFESPLSTIVIEGDASPAGTEAYNETLSWRRALAVYAEIRGLLSAPASGDFGSLSALNIGEARVELTAFGEVHGRLDGVPNGVDADEWRRAKVLINGSVMAFL